MDECTICLEIMKTDLVMLTCHHKFHTTCIKDYIKSIPFDVIPKCPICRRNTEPFMRFDYKYSKGKAKILYMSPRPFIEKKECCIIS